MIIFKVRSNNLSGYPISRSAAFTLAEVLITLGIIGIVAAMTMPSVIANVTERINSNKQANIAYKVTQATDKMKALGLLNGSYASTDAFVDELQKHLKIAKRCDASHIADCWPTEKVITSDGEEFEVKNARTGKNLNIKGNTSNNVGIVLADGSSLILTYNQDSQGMDVGDKITATPKTLPVGFGKSQDFAYTTNTTGAIDFVMDVNGKKGTNSETRDNKYHDIRSFKAARFSTGCAGVEVAGIGCVVNLGTSYDCLTRGTEDFSKWDPNGGISSSCWGGARKACDDIGMSIPDEGTLYSIYKKRYEYPALPRSGYFWSSTEHSANAVVYSMSNGGGGTQTFTKKYQSSTLCVGN